MSLEEDVREYKEIDIKNLTKILDGQMDEYNLDSKNTSKLNLVFFEACIQHIIRICRVLRSPRGNAMLIGVGGSGK